MKLYLFSIISFLLSTNFSSGNTGLTGASDDVISDSNIARFIQDNKNELVLQQTSEFQECRDLNKLDKNSTLSQQEKEDRVQKAQLCFQKKLKNKNLDDLKQVSSKLNLHDYKLIRSESEEEIRQYLNDKLYKAITGIDRTEKDLKKLQKNHKFKNRKYVDHLLYYKIFQSQLVKNALLEISTFCIESFRKENAAPQSGVTVHNFSQYWKDFHSHQTFNVHNVTDDGKPKFLISNASLVNDASKKNLMKDFIEIIHTTQHQLTDQLLRIFFLKCGGMINPLCQYFEKNQSNKGAKACLVKNRLNSVRKKIKLVHEIMEKIENDKKPPKDQPMIAIEMLKLYGDGQDANEVKLDDLTNHTSSEMFSYDNNKKLSRDKKLEKCEQKPELSQCEGIISQDDSLDKATNQLTTEMILKKEIEIKKLKEIKKKNEQDFENYLEEMGYFELLKAHQNGTLTSQDIETRIGEIFDGKRRALVLEMNKTMGKRQLKPQNKTALNPVEVKEVIQEIKSQPAQMAQSLLFNNIVTSFLETKQGQTDDSDDTTSSNRTYNVNTWRREEESLKNTNLDMSLFSNVSSAANKLESNDGPLSDANFLDLLLGK